MKDRVYSNSINKLIDYSIENDAIYLINEAQQGIPIFEWILQVAAKNPLTEN